jgi:hypothetical protein
VIQRTKTLFDEAGLAQMTNLMLYVGKLNASKKGKKSKCILKAFFPKTFVKKNQNKCN